VRSKRTIRRDRGRAQENMYSEEVLAKITKGMGLKDPLLPLPS
jgi:hypothetical protein